jgi:hypothetical protein
MCFAKFGYGSLDLGGVSRELTHTATWSFAKRSSAPTSSGGPSLCLLYSAYTCNDAEEIDIKSLSDFFDITVCNSSYFSKDAVVDHQSVDLAKGRYCKFDGLLT